MERSAWGDDGDEAEPNKDASRVEAAEFERNGEAGDGLWRAADSVGAGGELRANIIGAFFIVR